jgi:hypothetical protein
MKLAECDDRLLIEKSIIIRYSYSVTLKSYYAIIISNGRIRLNAGGEK